RGIDSPLPELAIQYGDFAIWQEKSLAGKDLREQIGYWTRQLAGLPMLEMPPDRPRPVAQTFHGKIESILLPRELTDRLSALANQEKATPFMVMLAVFNMLLQ